MRVDLHSLLVGSVSIGGLFGCFISEKLEDTIGRKRAFGIAFSFTSLGWLSVLFSYTSSMVFYARIVHGIGEGMTVAISIIYLGELKERYNRGVAIASVKFACFLCMPFAYIFGVFLTWRVGAVLITAPNVLSLPCTLIIQESPQWVSLKEKTNQDPEVMKSSEHVQTI